MTDWGKNTTHAQISPEKASKLHAELISQRFLPHRAIMQKLGKVAVFLNAQL